MTATLRPAPEGTEMIATIAAFAVLSDAVLMHKDPEFDARAGAVSMEALPYK